MGTFEKRMQTRQQLAWGVPSEGMAIELGVAAGTFSAQLLSTNPFIKTLYSIDKWDDHHDHAEMQRAQQTLSRFGARSKIIHATFAEALAQFEKESIDLIYIDGYAHTGQEEGKTLADWWPIVKPGGIFAGHDYDSKFPKTIEVVDRFVQTHHLVLQIILDRNTYASWWVEKPR